MGALALGTLMSILILEHDVCYGQSVTGTEVQQ